MLNNWGYGSSAALPRHTPPTSSCNLLLCTGWGALCPHVPSLILIVQMHLLLEFTRSYPVMKVLFFSQRAHPVKLKIQINTDYWPASIDVFDLFWETYCGCGKTALWEKFEWPRRRETRFTFNVPWHPLPFVLLPEHVEVVGYQERVQLLARYFECDMH